MAARPGTTAAGSRVPKAQVEAVVAGTRVLGALIAESLASAEPTVTMPQLRVLILAGDAPQSATAVAEDLGVHPSNATRTCDRLVAAGLLSRRPAEDDRRRVELTLTDSGRRLVDQVMEHRRARVAAIMARMSRTERAALAEALTAFSDAAGVAGAGIAEANPIHARHG